MVSSRSAYCRFHKKVVSAISTSKKRGKKAPSFAELEQLFLETKICRGCGVSLDPFKKYPRTSKRKDLATLQHKDDGGFEILCHICNVRAGGKFSEKIFDLPENMRGCPCCKQILPLKAFYIYRASYCMECCRTYVRERYVPRGTKKCSYLAKHSPSF